MFLNSHINKNLTVIEKIFKKGLLFLVSSVKIINAYVV